MNCCSAAVQIIKGYWELITNEVAQREIPGFALERIEICLKCEQRTWLNVAKWSINFTVGLIKKRLLKMGRMDLPINHKQGRFDTLWCSRCGCCVAAAALVEEKHCPENKWT